MAWRKESDSFWEDNEMDFLMGSFMDWWEYGNPKIKTSCVKENAEYGTACSSRSTTKIKKNNMYLKGRTYKRAYQLSYRPYQLCHISWRSPLTRIILKVPTEDCLHDFTTESQHKRRFTTLPKLNTQHSVLCT